MSKPTRRVPLGEPLPSSDAGLDERAKITPEDIEHAAAWWRENAPEDVRSILDSQPGEPEPCRAGCTNPNHPQALARANRFIQRSRALGDKGAALRALVLRGEHGGNPRSLVNRSAEYQKQSQDTLAKAGEILARIKQDHIAAGIESA